MLLSELKENQGANISFSDNQTRFQQRLNDLGFRNGERVLCVKRGLFSSPIIYFVNGAFIALRKKDAKRIEVVL